MPRFSVIDPKTIALTKNRFQNQNVLLLGRGNMGAAISDAIVRRSTPDDSLLLAYDPKQHSAAGIKFLPSFDVAINHPGVSCILPGMKPQDWNIELKQAMEAIRDLGKLVLPYMAGLGVPETGGDIVWMPNMLAAVNRSVIFAYAPPEVSLEKRLQFSELLMAAGEVVWVENPEDMHIGVAVSGSAPAYILNFMDEAVAQLEALDVSRKEALKLVIDLVQQLAGMVFDMDKCEDLSRMACVFDDDVSLQMFRMAVAYVEVVREMLPDELVSRTVGHTIAGTAELINSRFQLNGNCDFKSIIQSIRSKGGTTDKALLQLEKLAGATLTPQDEFNALFHRALYAAHDQSILLRDNAVARLKSESKGSHTFFGADAQKVGEGEGFELQLK
ncbi:MAG: hypothetical protein K0U24_02290 [Gammaproteobacteria bacterium]|nr:hypothetical protein [Gammaproteobacteria bacterium]MCH9763051.1 hypothetical protein [Gammaproteobacteria bacterium]